MNEIKIRLLSTWRHELNRWTNDSRKKNCRDLIQRPLTMTLTLALTKSAATRDTWHDVIGRVQLDYRFNAESVVELARERITSLFLSHHVSVTCALSFCKETVGEAAWKLRLPTNYRRSRMLDRNILLALNLLVRLSRSTRRSLTRNARFAKTRFHNPLIRRERWTRVRNDITA